MDALELFSDILRKLNVEYADTAPEYIRADGITAINSAYQQLWLGKVAHFKRQTITQAVSAASTALADNIQEIIGPVRVSGYAPLFEITERNHFDQYATRFLGALTNTRTAARPDAYFVERLRQDEVEGTQINLLVTPTPDTSYSLLMDVVLEAPSFTLDTFCCPTERADLQIPHQYVESLLLPIARYHVTRSHWFTNAGLYPGIQADYMAALRSIGLADPVSQDHKPGQSIPGNPGGPPQPAEAA